MASEAITKNDLKAILEDVLIAKLPVDDYVVEHGTDGIWTYRKWASGIAECWGSYTASIAITTSSPSYGGYRSGDISIPNFPFSFATAPTVTATANTPTGYWVNNTVPYTTHTNLLLSAGASLAAANRTIGFYVIGKWK